MCISSFGLRCESILMLVFPARYAIGISYKKGVTVDMGSVDFGGRLGSTFIIAHSDWRRASAMVAFQTTFEEIMVRIIHDDMRIRSTESE